MMKKITETLWNDYNKVSNQIEGLEKSDPNYEMLFEERDKIRNELIKLEQAEMETNLKVSQIDAENKRDKTRNAISIGTFAVTTCVGIWTVVKTFKFDQDSTVTSTLGRNNIFNNVSRMFTKR